VRAARSNAHADARAIDLLQRLTGSGYQVLTVAAGENAAHRA
jgi:hypothetical protein